MSLWADQQVKELLNRVRVLEIAVEEMNKPAKVLQPATPEPQDKRTKEWREWKQSH